MERNGKITVAVIGGGLSGITAVKSALEEGLIPTCFEQDDKLGGLWYYTDHIRENQGASGYSNLVCNDGKENMAFSDFPVPEKNPQNMTWQEYLQYIRDYADHFGVTKHVQCNTTVTKVKPAMDYPSTGRWEVHTKVKGSEDVKVQTFDKVMVASGPLRNANMPKVDGMDIFKGQIMHVKEYRRPELFKGKNVIIVGAGFYGSELAYYSADLAKQTYFVVKSDGGLYMFPKMSIDGNIAFSMGLPRNLMYDMDWETQVAPIFRNVALQYLDTEKLGISPKATFLMGGRAGVSQDIRDHFKTGRIIGKRGLKRLTENSAIFDDGSEVNDVDVVVFATGFGPDFSFIDVPDIKGIKSAKELNSYLFEFPISLQHDSLALICQAPWYNPYSVNAELHGRLAARVFSGKHRLPSLEKRQKWIDDKIKYFNDKTGGKFMTLPVRFSDEIAKELGVLPTFWRIFWRSPSLAHKVYYGPNLPVIYRLVGPGAKKSAWREYDECYRRGYAGGTPPPMPSMGVHHYAMAGAVAVAGVAAAAGLMLKSKALI